MGLINTMPGSEDNRASLFCLFGWLANDGDRGDGWTDIVTVVKVWGYSFGVTVIILLVCESRSSSRCDPSFWAIPDMKTSCYQRSSGWTISADRPEVTRMRNSRTSYRNYRDSLSYMRRITRVTDHIDSLMERRRGIQTTATRIRARTRRMMARTREKARARTRKRTRRPKQEAQKAINPWLINMAPAAMRRVKSRSRISKRKRRGRVPLRRTKKARRPLRVGKPKRSKIKGS
jgi:hypothetical protein